MPDALGYRAKIGVLVPSTNTIVEPELHAMAPPGVTIQTGRIPTESQDLRDDAAEDAFRQHMLRSLGGTLSALMTCAPDYLIMGLSAPTFHGGQAGSAALTRQLETQSGLRVSTGAEACQRALRALGARRIGVLSPYKPASEAAVRRFFGDYGYDVVAMASVRSPRALEIAAIGADEIMRQLHELDSAEVEALVQVGTNLAMARLAGDAERVFGKPVVAVNTATLWDSLRRLGLDDRVAGFGCLLREH